MRTLLTFLIIILFSNISFAQSTAIPDPIFEQELINLGYDSGPINGFVPTTNINTVTFLDVNFKNINDLTGIEDFTALTILYCQNNLLTNLNVTQNTALIWLRCSYNQLTSLDVSQNTNLTSLVCTSNLLSSLDVSQNPLITGLQCDNNQITNLDLTTQINLSTFACDNNQLSSLNITQNINLNSLWCYGNQITSLDITQNILLTTFSCQNNLIPFLDVTQNPLLNNLWCSGNLLTSLNISQNPNINDFYCSGNNLTCLNVKNGNNANFVNFYANNNPALTCIEVDSIAYSTTNWTNIDAGVTFDTSCINSCIVVPCSATANYTYVDNGGGNYSFTDLSLPASDTITGWLWNFGNGDTSTTQSPTYMFNINSTYTVSLIITTSQGCGHFFNQVINVSSAICNFSPSFSYINNGSNNVSFTDNTILSGTPPFSYYWNFTLDTSSVQNPNYTYPYNGDWYATLKISDATGCSDSSSQLISVSSLPCDASFSYIDNGNGNFSFSSSPTGVSPFGYLWNFDDDTGTVQSPNPIHIFTSNGTYAVGLLTQDINVCETLDFDTITITNIGCSSFSPSFSFVNNGNGNYSFTNTSTGSFTSSYWAFGDGNTSLISNPNQTFSANGTYVVVLAISDSLIGGTCIDYYTTTINVTGVPAPPACNSGFVIYSDTISNNFIVVNSSTGNNLTFFWDFGDGNTSTQAFPNYTYTSSGPFYLCLTINDGTGCIDMYCDSIGSNGVVFKQAGFTINVISPIATGVSDNTLLTELKIYPNPTTKTINIDLGELKNNLIATLTNNLGQVVFTQTFKSTDFIQLGIDAPKGIYFLQLQTEEGSITRKIIKK